jgi:hypothetical protein
MMATPGAPEAAGCAGPASACASGSDDAGKMRWALRLWRLPFGSKGDRIVPISFVIGTLGGSQAGGAVGHGTEYSNDSWNIAGPPGGKPSKSRPPARDTVYPGALS